MSAAKGVNQRRYLLQQNEMKDFNQSKMNDLTDLNISFTAYNKQNTFLIEDIDAKQQYDELEASKNTLQILNHSQNQLDEGTQQSFRRKKSQLAKSSLDGLGLNDDNHNQADQNSFICQREAQSVILQENNSKTNNSKFKGRNLNQQQRRSMFAQLINPERFQKNIKQLNNGSNLNNGVEISELDGESPNQNKSLQKLKLFNIFFFRQTNLIKRFITNLQSQTRSYIFKRLSKHQFDLIGDKSADYYQFQKMNLILSIDSMFCMIWDFLTMIAWIIIVFYIPFRVSFIEFQEEQMPSLFQIAIVMFLVVETLIKLNKAVYKRGRIITNREFIISKYLKNESIFDFFILVSYIISLYKFQFRFLEYILELRILRVVKTYRELFSRFDQEAKHAIFQRISQLILFILCFINLQGSIFVLLGVSEGIDPIKFNQVESIQYQRYVAGLYWSTITMATIGYGDIIPESTTERIYVSIVSLISCGIFGYSISQIGGIVMELQNKSDLFNKKMQALNKLMNSRQMSKKMIYQVIKYYEYLYEAEDDDLEDQGLQMIECLPKSMREKIAYEMNHKLIYSHKVFSLNFSKPFLDKLSIKVKSMKMGPETDLYKQGEFDKRLYFIHKGAMTLYFQQNQVEKECAVLTKGDILGEIEFLGQISRKFGAKSQTVVHLLFIEFDDFYQILQQYEADFESYNQMKDKFRLEGNLKNINRKCESCGKFNHLFFNCFSLQYSPNVDLVLRKTNTPVQQERNNCHTRASNRTPNALLNYCKSGLDFQEFITSVKVGTENNLDDRFLNSISSAYNLNQNQEQDTDSPIFMHHIIDQQVDQMRDLQRSIADSKIMSKQSSLKLGKVKQNLKINVPTKSGANEQYTQQQFDERILDNRLQESIKLKQGDLFVQINQQNDGQNLVMSPENIQSENRISIQDNVQSLTDKSFLKMLSQGIIKPHNYNNLGVNYESERGRSPSDFNYNPQLIDNQQQNPQLQSLQKIKLLHVQNENNTLSPQQAIFDKMNRISMEKYSYQYSSINLWFSNFEKVKSYQIYFPHNNCEKVIAQYKKIQMINQSKKRKKRLKNKNPSSSRIINQTVDKNSKGQLSFIQNFSNQYINKQTQNSLRKIDKQQ